MKRPIPLLFIAAALLPAEGPLPKDDGYRGIWYYNQRQNDEYVYKYSGGFATYPQQQSPIAIYSKEADKTFFVYGGTLKEKSELLHMVSYYDHATGQVPRPRILLNKKTEDAHDNPVMSIDERGHIWVFSNSHGTARPSYISRSVKPYSIDEFELVRTTNFSYGHPWRIPGKGFFFLHSIYGQGGRSLFWASSPDGRTWQDAQLLARAENGHYQITCQEGQRVATVFNIHPKEGVNFRANLYYLETSDMGKTWKTAGGRTVAPPVTEAANPALVYDSRADGLLVYLKTVQFDRQGRPVILYLTTKGWESGPKHGIRQWWTARWTGKQWEIRKAFESDHNYDFGSLGIDNDGTWRLVAPTEPGPQAWCTGGEMVLWTSRDQGKSWHRAKQLTNGSARNHTYARLPVNAHPAFYALWADGDAKQPSGSDLYFTDRDGARVWRLPRAMAGEFARPEAAW
jgi:hypothetical protein